MNLVQEWIALDCTHQQERAAQYRYKIARERYRMLERHKEVGPNEPRTR